MTAVAPLPSLQPIAHSGWNGSNGIPSSSHHAPSSNPSKPSGAKKASQRAGSVPSASSKSHPETLDALFSALDEENARVKKSKSHTSLKGDANSVTNVKSSVRSHPRSVSTDSASSNPGPNGTLSLSNTNTAYKVTPQETPILSLKSTNGTFELKVVPIPFHPNSIRIGRLQTNQKSATANSQLYFDSKVLSRAHAEVWADESGQIYIKDVKSSNGTFLNNKRLSLEGSESEVFPLRERDILELGIDIYTEDQKEVVHRKIGAKVIHAGFAQDGLSKALNSVTSKQRSSSQNSNVSRTSTVIPAPPSGPAGYKSPFLTAPPVLIDDIGKLITADTLRAKQDSADILRIRAQLATIIAARESRRVGHASQQENHHHTHHHQGLDRRSQRLGQGPRSDSSHGSSDRLSDPNVDSSNGQGSYLSVSPVGDASFSSQSSPEIDHKRLGPETLLPEISTDMLSESDRPLDLGGQDLGPSAFADLFADSYSKHLQGLPSETSSILKDMDLIVQPSIPRLVEALSHTKLQLDNHVQYVDTLERLLREEKKKSESLECQKLELYSMTSAALTVADQVSASPVSDLPSSGEQETKLKEMEEQMVLINTELTRTKSLLDEYRRRAEEAEKENRQYVAEREQAENPILPSPVYTPPSPRTDKPVDIVITQPAGSTILDLVQNIHLSDLDDHQSSRPLSRSSFLLNGLRSRSASLSRDDSGAIHLLEKQSNLPSSPSSSIFAPMCPATAAEWLLRRAGLADGQFITAEHIQRLEAGLATIMKNSSDQRDSDSRLGGSSSVASATSNTATTLTATTIMKTLLDEPGMMNSTLPYTSLVGVVLVGVGLMAWLNGWQRNR